LIDRIAAENVLCIADDIRPRHCKKFLQLHKTQHPPGPSDNSRTVISHIKLPLEEAARSDLSKDLNYTMASRHIPVRDFLCGVGKAVGTPPEETAEEIQ
jgi:hypothetical protein